jgi:hypothetical protein
MATANSGLNMYFMLIDKEKGPGKSQPSLFPIIKKYTSIYKKI